MDPCKSYRPGKGLCADGFLQCGYCRNGKTGIYNKPMCLGDDVPKHLASTFLDESGKPKQQEVSR